MPRLTGFFLRYFLSSRYDRTLPSHDGPATTSRQLKDVARRYLAHLEQKLQTKPKEVLRAWPKVIGRAFVGMTRAEKFEEGVLHVKVSNSSLLSLLHTVSERKRLAQALQIEAPGVVIKDISFRIG